MTTPYPNSPHPTRGMHVWALLPNTITRQVQRRLITRFVHPSGELEPLAPYWPEPSGSGTESPSADAFYRGADLEKLRAAMATALDDLAGRPERWEVLVREPVRPERAPVACEVTAVGLRERLLDILEGIDLAIHRRGVVELQFQ